VGPRLGSLGQRENGPATLSLETMSRTESTMLALGTTAPGFALKDVVSGRMVSLADFEGKKALLVMFICRHCPYVKHLQNGLAQLGKDYAGGAVGIVAISSNDADAYPDDSPESLREMAAELGFMFPFCYDATQEVARSYSAACTPDFFVFDGERRLVYRGQFDDSRRGNTTPVTGRDIRAAIDAVLAGRRVETDQRPSIGCNIKWRAE
jgi:peroxiredoxin